MHQPWSHHMIPTAILRCFLPTWRKFQNLLRGQVPSHLSSPRPMRRCVKALSAFFSFFLKLTKLASLCSSLIYFRTLGAKKTILLQVLTFRKWKKFVYLYRACLNLLSIFFKMTKHHQRQPILLLVCICKDKVVCASSLTTLRLKIGNLYLSIIYPHLLIYLRRFSNEFQ